MMEMFMLGITLTVSLVVASLLVAFISYKVMMSPKVIGKLYKDMYKVMFESMKEFENIDQEEEESE